MTEAVKYYLATLTEKAKVERARMILMRPSGCAETQSYPATRYDCDLFECFIENCFWTIQHST